MHHFLREMVSFDLVDLERAFQTQVLHGGTLDTALLELGTVSQTQIIKYLSMANGLPGSTGPLKIDDKVASTVTDDTAASYGVVPLEIKDNELTVLVRDDIALEDLNALSKKLSLSVRPLVTTELNFLETRHRLYSHRSFKEVPNDFKNSSDIDGKQFPRNLGSARRTNWRKLVGKSSENSFYEGQKIIRTCSEDQDVRRKARIRTSQRCERKKGCVKKPEEKQKEAKS